jgi:hypothetical protein
MHTLTQPHHPQSTTTFIIYSHQTFSLTHITHTAIHTFTQKTHSNSILHTHCLLPIHIHTCIQIHLFMHSHSRTYTLMVNDLPWKTGIGQHLFEGSLWPLLPPSCLISSPHSLWNLQLTHEHTPMTVAPEPRDNTQSSGWSRNQSWPQTHTQVPLLWTDPTSSNPLDTGNHLLEANNRPSSSRSGTQPKP